MLQRTTVLLSYLKKRLSSYILEKALKTAVECFRSSSLSAKYNTPEVTETTLKLLTLTPYKIGGQFFFNGQNKPCTWKIPSATKLLGDLVSAVKNGVSITPEQRFSKLREFWLNELVIGVCKGYVSNRESKVCKSREKLVELANSEIVRAFGPSFLYNATLVSQTVKSLVMLKGWEAKYNFSCWCDCPTKQTVVFFQEAGVRLSKLS